MKTFFSTNANAKINLGLKVISKRNDGFHNIESIFIEINICDTISFTPSKKFKLSCDDKLIPIDEKNTIYKAYSILRKKYNFKSQYEIFLKKNIPTCAGLGGGSSNAACIINTLNKLENLNLSLSQKLDIALSIGCDVPFFIEGGVKLVRGRGEIILPINHSILKNIYIILILPSFTISTEWAYHNLKNNLDENIYCDKFPPLDEYTDWKFFKNDFEDVVDLTYPEILEIKKFLYNNGALYSGLSGSGSTMFGIYNDKTLIEEIQKKIIKYKTIIVSPI